MNKHRFIIIGMFSMIFILLFLMPSAYSQEKTDGQKMEEAKQIFEKFREQSNAVDRDQFSRMNYSSLYQSKLRSSLMLAIRLADLGDCKEKVNQYNRHMKFKYKNDGTLTEEKEEKIDDWSSDIRDRCHENESDLLDFIQDAIETCLDALYKYSFNNPTSLEQDKVARRDMRDILKTDIHYKEFNKKSNLLKKYYPELSKLIMAELDRWIPSVDKPTPETGLPLMKKYGPMSEKKASTHIDQDNSMLFMNRSN